jgi:cytochrome c-type biogenesis protein
MLNNLLQLVSNSLETGNVLVFMFVFLAGVLTSFTPCVYPVIPLTVAYFGTQSGGSKLKTFFLVCFYVIGMSLIYAVLGMAAGLSGTLFGKVSVHPITFFIFANICIFLGLSMLGVFTIPLPSFLTTGQGHSHKKGCLGSFILGCFAGLIVGPCTAPVLAVLLAYVAMKKTILFGGSLLFVFSLGMGSLLLVLGILAGNIQFLPKSGKWLNIIKKFFGIIMLGVAEYFLIKAGQMWFF